MKHIIFINFSCLFAFICNSNECTAQPNSNQKQNTAPDWYQEALKANKENSHLIEANQPKFDTSAIKQKEIDFSQDNAQTFLKLYLLQEQQSGDTTIRFGIKVTEADIPRK